MRKVEEIVRINRMEALSRWHEEEEGIGDKDEDVEQCG